jgi:hypothetical protein
LIYEWCFNEEQTSCQINKRYGDSAATMRHLQSFGGFAERFMTAVTPLNLVLLGNRNANVREGLAGLNPTDFDMHSRFSR